MLGTATQAKAQDYDAGEKPWIRCVIGHALKLKPKGVAEYTA